MDAIFEQTEGAKTVKIYYDDDPMPPWDWDLFGHIAHWSNYNFGEGRYPSDDDFGQRYEGYMTADDFLEWADENDAIMLPLYVYDHGGVTISTAPFSCPWDSGQIGWIYVTRAEVLEEWGRQKMSKKLQALVIKNLRLVVEEIDQYWTGQVYGFELEGELGEFDSCWGFYGYEPEDLAAAVLNGEV